nr:uncharacterized protein LOC105719692 isoform X2 [Aotus nancymaae]
MRGREWVASPQHLPPLPTVLLAAGPVPGAGGHQQGQLLHHRTHHHRRPLHQEHVHAYAVHLLLCHPAGQRPGLHHWLQREAGSQRLALGLAGVPCPGHDHRNAHPHPGPGHQERPYPPAWGPAQGPDLMAPRYEGPDLKGPWACGSHSTCTTHKSCRRWRSCAAAHLVGPRTASSSGPSPFFTGFLGVVTGAGAMHWCCLRTQRANPLVCAVGMLGSAIFICLIFVAAKNSIVGAYANLYLRREDTAVFQLGHHR